MFRLSRPTPAHIAWLLPAGTLFFACGILLGSGISSWYPILAALAAAIAAAVLLRGRLRYAAGMMIVLCLGALSGWHAWHPALPAEETCIVRGTVCQSVEWEAKTSQVQTVLCDVTLDGGKCADAYWTYYLAEGETPPAWLKPGVQVEFTARVYHPSGQDNPGGFDFKEYLMQRGIGVGVYGADNLSRISEGFSFRGWAAACRYDLSMRLMAVMGEEAGAYAAAMLLGTRDFIPSSDRAAFNELGIAHILAVSGFHVGVLAGMLTLLMRPLALGRRMQIVLETIVLTSYCLLTGGNVPVIRASGLLLWRHFTRLRHHQVLPLHTLCVTALVQLIVNPTLLTGPSFQLTYGAMLGLTLVYPRLKRWHVFRHAAAQKLWDAFAATLAAQIGILWPQLYWFGKLPLLSLVLNMGVMAYAGGLIVLYWVTLVSLPVPGLCGLLGGCSAAATAPMLAVVRGLGRLEVVSLWTRQADALTFIGWLLLLAGTSALLSGRRAKYRWKTTLAGSVLVALILLPLPEHAVAYTQFSVGNADAAILQDRDMTVVIDTGEDGQAIANYLHQRRQSVELLLITHLHSDHAGGIAGLLEAGIPVEVCCIPSEAETPQIDPEMLPLLQALEDTGTEIRYLHRGSTVELPSGSFQVLWPEAGWTTSLHDANDACMVLYGQVGGVTMLLTADLTGTYAHYTALPADILKVSHHGSKADTTEAFLSAVSPQLLLLSNANQAREAHMTALAGPIPLYSTQACGAVTITFAGNGEFAVSTVLNEWENAVAE